MRLPGNYELMDYRRMEHSWKKIYREIFHKAETLLLTILGHCSQVLISFFFGEAIDGGIAIRKAWFSAGVL